MSARARGRIGTEDPDVTAKRMATVQRGLCCSPSANAAIDFATARAAQLSGAARVAVTASLTRLLAGPPPCDLLEAVQRYLRLDTHIIVHFSPWKDERITKMLADTHYRNQFEVGLTCGSNDLTLRRKWESDLFNGVYDGEIACHRPKYGVQNVVGDPNGVAVCRPYGLSYFILRGVRMRSTFTSCDSSQPGCVCATPDEMCHVLEKFSDQELGMVLKVALGHASHFSAESIEVYKEVQIHGELRFADHVAVMVLHESDYYTAGDPAEFARRKDIVEKFCDRNHCGLHVLSSRVAADVHACAIKQLVGVFKFAPDEINRIDQELREQQTAELTQWQSAVEASKRSLLEETHARKKRKKVIVLSDDDE